MPPEKETDNAAVLRRLDQVEQTILTIREDLAEVKSPKEKGKLEAKLAELDALKAKLQEQIEKAGKAPEPVPTPAPTPAPQPPAPPAPPAPKKSFMEENFGGTW